MLARVTGLVVVTVVDVVDDTSVVVALSCTVESASTELATVIETAFGDVNAPDAERASLFFLVDTKRLGVVDDEFIVFEVASAWVLLLVQIKEKSDDVEIAWGFPNLDVLADCELSHAVPDVVIGITTGMSAVAYVGRTDTTIA